MKNAPSFRISGQVVDLINDQIFPGIVEVADGRVVSITKTDSADPRYIMPGFVDAHIHIESSMLTPAAFARLAVVHGTVATVSDPHEIANVLGVEGVHFMIENGKKIPFKFYFGAPSCVPATTFESSGAVLGIKELDALLSMPEIPYLAEMMNYPGVLYHDPEVEAKLELAKKHGKPVDGHAPGLTGEQARLYAQAGITTDHECFTMEEALDKIRYGMKIQIREGSAAKNFDALIPLMDNHADKVLFCSDDKHPDDLVKGHINELARRAIALGYPPMKVLKSCILNPIRHYSLDVGLLQPGDAADFIVVDNLKTFNVQRTFINGIKVAENGKSLINTPQSSHPNRFEAHPLSLSDLQIPAGNKKIRIIEVIEGQLITKTILDFPKVEKGYMVSDTERDYLKIMVLNRYEPSKASFGFIHNFGMIQGALASTVAHDSHNLIAVGVDDESLLRTVNQLIDSKGGIAVVCGDEEILLPLPVAGLMSDADGYEVAKAYEAANALAKKTGTPLHAPFMTLSFMALLVIPQLKISDKGLFDGEKFCMTQLEVD
ncbi:MAG: adenine deaminase [Bacteroidales bacterium]|nr:adenine deaminase [Bacteroidales bacterium]